MAVPSSSRFPVGDKVEWAKSKLKEDELERFKFCQLEAAKLARGFDRDKSSRTLENVEKRNGFIDEARELIDKGLSINLSIKGKRLKTCASSIEHSTVGIQAMAQFDLGVITDAAFRLEKEINSHAHTVLQQAEMVQEIGEWAAGDDGNVTHDVNLRSDICEAVIRDIDVYMPDDMKDRMAGVDFKNSKTPFQKYAFCIFGLAARQQRNVRVFTDASLRDRSFEKMVNMHLSPLGVPYTCFVIHKFTHGSFIAQRSCENLKEHPQCIVIRWGDSEGGVLKVLDKNVNDGAYIMNGNIPNEVFLVSEGTKYSLTAYVPEDALDGKDTLKHLDELKEYGYPVDKLKELAQEEGMTGKLSDRKKARARRVQGIPNVPRSVSIASSSGSAPPIKSTEPCVAPSSGSAPQIVSTEPCGPIGSVTPPIESHVRPPLYIQIDDISGDSD